MKWPRRWPVALGSALLIVTGIVPGVTSARGVSGALAAAHPYDDQFTAPSLNPKWHWVRNHPHYWSVTTHPGYLRIITEATDIWQGYNATPVLLENAPAGDFAISTYVRITPTEDYQQGGIIMYGDDNNYVRITYGYLAGLGCQLGFQANAHFTGKEHHLTSSAKRPGYFLQLDKRGGTYVGYCSENGVAWAQVGTTDQSALHPSQIGLLALNSGANGHVAQIPADFDFFQERTIPAGSSGPLPLVMPKPAQQ